MDEWYKIIFIINVQNFRGSDMLYIVYDFE
jgi:hypothetical protein